MEILLLLILAIPLVFGVRYYLKTQIPEYKGKVGEAVVAKYLKKLPDDEYFVYNDIYLKTGNGSIQIDHLVLSIYGIFVIETKNYSGWIFGSDNQNYWTQIIYNNKTKFKNPIKQNRAHINSLKYILSEYKFLKYFPIIVFTGSAELKSINSMTPVIYEDKLYHYLLRSAEEQIFDKDQLQNISRIVENYIIQDENIEVKHLQNINRNIYERENKIDLLMCPKCDGTLKIRDGSHGKFYGCSKYPICRFTRNCR